MSTSPVSGKILKVPKQPAGRFIIVSMMFLFMVINLADRAVFGISIPLIQEEFRLSPQQSGLIGGLFFLLFPFTAIAVGYLADRYGSRWILLLLALGWLLAQLIGANAQSEVGLMASRIMLGAFEGPAYAMALLEAYRAVGQGRRSVTTAVIALGSAIGLMVALPPLGWFISHSGWRAGYYLLATLCLAWSVVWVLCMPTHTPKGTGSKTRQIRSATLLGYLLNPIVLGLMVAGLGANGVIALTSVWIAPFAHKVSGLDLTQASVVAGLPWGLGALIALIAGHLSDRLTGKTTLIARQKGILAAAVVVIGGGLLACIPLAADTMTQLFILVVAVSLPGTCIVLGSSLIGDIVLEEYRGRVLGIVSAIVTIASLLSPVLVGRAVGAGDAIGFVEGFGWAGLFCMGCGAVGAVFVYRAAGRRESATSD